MGCAVFLSSFLGFNLLFVKCFLKVSAPSALVILSQEFLFLPSALVPSLHTVILSFLISFSMFFLSPLTDIFTSEALLRGSSMTPSLH